MSIPSSGLPGLPGSAPAMPQGMDPNDPNAKMVSPLSSAAATSKRNIQD